MEVTKFFKRNINQLRAWSQKRITGLFVLNLTLIILLLLHSAGYFSPYFYLNIDAIFFLTILLGIIILRIKSRIIFLISLIFLMFAGLLDLFRVDIWAERSGIYAYQALFIAVVFMIINGLKKTNPKNEKV